MLPNRQGVQRAHEELSADAAETLPFLRKHRVTMRMAEESKHSPSTIGYERWRKPPSSLISSVKGSSAVYRRLGNSGLIVSNPILGGLHVGSSKWNEWVLDEKEGIALLKAAYDRGINTVCVSLCMASYCESETIFLVGHCQYILQWEVRRGHGQSAEDLQHSKERSRYHD